MEPCDIRTLGKKRMDEGEGESCGHSKKLIVHSKASFCYSKHDTDQGMFDAFPNEIFEMILSFISDHCTFSRIIQVNKKWNAIGEALWYHYCSAKQLLPEELFWKEKGKTWKWILMTRTRIFTDGHIKNGPGTYKESGQTVYGDFVENKKNGWGIEIWNDSIYTGQWLEDERHGFGMLQVPSGARYVGHWVANKKEGHGVYTFPNGDKYEGEWKNDMKHGEGKYTFGKGKWEGDRYHGEWKDNKKCGIGRYYWKDGDTYFGEFADDNFNGSGTYHFMCGDCYIGEWKADRRFGHGVYTYFHGGMFEGSFKDGKREGLGIFKWKDGDYFQGVWFHGSRKGRGILYKTNGEQIIQEWNEPFDANYSITPPPKFP